MEDPLLMPSLRPEISVVVATHMRSKLLSRTLESVLKSEHPNFELIVVSDERSTDTASVVLSCLRPQDTFVSLGSGGGPADSRNLGACLASGDYLVFVDDDDGINPSYLKEASNFGRQNPGCIGYCDFDVVVEDREKSLQIESKRLAIGANDMQSVWVKNFIPNSALVYPKHVYKEVKHDSGLACYEDWDFLLASMKVAPLQHYESAGPVIYKDYIRRESRRGGGAEQDLALAKRNFLLVYARQRAPTAAIRLMRMNLLKSVGLSADDIQNIF
jgi:glycosyltransferase involved in cell wall biosynthesis